MAVAEVQEKIIQTMMECGDIEELLRELREAQLAEQIGMKYCPEGEDFAKRYPKTKLWRWNGKKLIEAKAYPLTRSYDDYFERISQIVSKLIQEGGKPEINPNDGKTIDDLRKECAWLWEWHSLALDYMVKNAMIIQWMFHQNLGSQDEEVERLKKQVAKLELSKDLLEKGIKAERNQTKYFADAYDKQGTKLALAQVAKYPDEKLQERLKQNQAELKQAKIDLTEQQRKYSKLAAEFSEYMSSGFARR